jgi:transcriptional regulator with XRE-family HTH domain
VKKQRAPHLRLKAVRKITGDTQAAFARRIGVSYPYVLSVETGQRKMNVRFAQLVMHATGVSSDWLIRGTSKTPVCYSGIFRHPITSRFHLRSDEPFTRESFDEWAEKPRPPFNDVDPDSDQARLIDDFSVALASLMKASARKGRFNVCAYYITEMMESVKAKLNLKVSDDANEVPTWMFGEEFDSDCGDVSPSEIMTAWRMLSPSGKTKWGSALNGSQPQREALLVDLDETRTAVEASFSAKRLKRSSRRVQRRAQV